MICHIVLEKSQFIQSVKVNEYIVMQSLCGDGSAFATATVPLSATATMNTWKPDISILCRVSSLMIISMYVHGMF